MTDEKQGRATPPVPEQRTRIRRMSDGWYSDDGGLSWINPAPNAEPQVVGTTRTFQAIATTYPGTVCGTGLATRAAPPDDAPGMSLFASKADRDAYLTERSGEGVQTPPTETAPVEPLTDGQILEAALACALTEHRISTVIDFARTIVRRAAQPAPAAQSEPPAPSEEFERGRQQGMKQERALWELAASSQEIEFAAPVAPPVEPIMSEALRDAMLKRINAGVQAAAQSEQSAAPVSDEHAKNESR